MRQTRPVAGLAEPAVIAKEMLMRWTFETLANPWGGERIPKHLNRQDDPPDTDGQDGLKAGGSSHSGMTASTDAENHQTGKTVHEP
jgi:hypothetical protein